MARGEWSVVEGVRDVARFLARRLPVALLYALPIVMALLHLAVLAAFTGELSYFTILFAFAGAGAGYPIGVILCKDLLRHVGFVGWEPILLGALAALGVVLLATLLACWWPGNATVFRATLLAASLAIGAFGAVARHTWAEA